MGFRCMEVFFHWLNRPGDVVISISNFYLSLGVAVRFVLLLTCAGVGRSCLEYVHLSSDKRIPFSRRCSFTRPAIGPVVGHSELAKFLPSLTRISPNTLQEAVYLLSAQLLSVRAGWAF
jgi:hypothetical protein